jgi:gamma-glutamyltranspeptidase/glutathione hydrolase
MRKESKLRRLMLSALPVILTACPGGASAQNSGLIIDTNEDSCSVASNGDDPIIVGSEVPGDPSLPEPASGYRLGYQAKHSSKYMVVANTPLAAQAGCEILKAGTQPTN